jgi:hypothetical protein
MDMHDQEEDMKLRSRIPVILGGLALTAGLGVATAVPSSAITTREDISYDNQGQYLATCTTPAAGVTVVFFTGGPCPSGDEAWDYQLEGAPQGDRYYYVHPHGYDNLCMTASTTQFGVIKIENCVSADQQYWFNPDYYNGTLYEYHLYNDYWGAYLYQTDDLTTGLTFNCSYGVNDCSYYEP